MKRVFLAGVALTALLFTACGSKNASESAGEDSATVVEVDETASPAAEEYKVTDNGIVSANGLPMVVDFSAEWCPPCRQLKPIFADLKKEYAGKVDFVSIDVDNNSELAEQYKIESIPALVYINPDGKEVFRTVGFREGAQIKADVAAHLE